MPTVYKKIAVLGGTGKAGKYLIRELLREGYRVKALARNPQKIDQADESLEIIEGNAREYESIIPCFQVARLLSARWALQVHEPDTCSIATGHILKAMQELNIQRFIEVAGLGIDAPWIKKDY